MKKLDLKDIAKRYFETNSNVNEDSLYKFLIIYKYDIAQLYNYDCHREDIIYRLEECDYNVEKIPDKLLNEMTDLFEDRLADNGSEGGWIYILDYVIDYYKEDLEDYNIRREINNG